MTDTGMDGVPQSLAWKFGAIIESHLVAWGGIYGKHSGITMRRVSKA